MNKKESSVHSTATDANQADSAQQTSDVITEQVVNTVTIDSTGTVDAATNQVQAQQPQSIKDALTGAAATMAGSVDGGSAGMPKDPAKFSLGFWIQMQVLSILVGFRTFMVAVKRPQNAALVPAAAGAIIQQWPVLDRLVHGALEDISLPTLTALLARLTFIQKLVQYAGTLTTRLAAVQSHIEDQLAKQMRPLYDRCQKLFLTHDDLMEPMAPLVQLFAQGGQQAAESRKNNQKVADKAVTAAQAKTTPQEPGTTTPPANSTPPASTTPPAGTGTVAVPVKAAQEQQAPKKGRTRK